MAHLITETQGYFIEGINNVRDFHSRKYGFTSSEDAAIYVAGVLEDASIAESGRLVLNESLFSSMEKCFSQSGFSDYERFRSLGDTSLVVGGMFPESVGLPEDYFAAMGITGYYNAAARRSGMRAIHLELSDRFIPWLRIIRDFRHDKEIVTTRDWIELYDAAIRLSSEYLRERAAEEKPPGILTGGFGRAD